MKNNPTQTLDKLVQALQNLHENKNEEAAKVLKRLGLPDRKTEPTDNRSPMEKAFEKSLKEENYDETLKIINDLEHSVEKAKEFLNIK